MPSWGIHLAIAKKVSEKYKVDDNLFFYGNLVPDNDNTDFYKRRYTHFYTDLRYEEFPEEYIIDLKEFLNKYKKYINNSFFLGYYTHLIADYSFNSTFFKKKWVVDENKKVIGLTDKNGKFIKTDMEGRKHYKHNDFDSYSKYVFNKIGNPNVYYEDCIKQASELLEPKFLNEELIHKRIEFLKTKHINKNKYTLKEKIFGLKFRCLEKEEYDKIFNDTLELIYEKLDELGIEHKV